MGDVVQLKLPANDIPAERVLKAALEVSFKNVIVIGMMDNEEVYFAFSDGGNTVLDTLGMLDVAHDQLLRAING